MALYQVNAGDRILAADSVQFYNILKGVAASGENITLIYNAAASLIFQPSSDPAAGTESVQIKNNAGTVQSALSFDGRFYPADGLVGTPGVAFEQDKDTGLWRVSANVMALVSNGVEQLRVDATGVSIDAGANYLDTQWTDSAALTLTQGVSVTFTQTYARYKIIGKTVLAQIRLAITSVGTAGSIITVATIPAAIQPKQAGQHNVAGTFLYFRTGPTTWQSGIAEASTATTMTFLTGGSAIAGYLGTVPNFATANGDILVLNLSYELA